MSDALVTSATKTLYDNGSSYGSKLDTVQRTRIASPEYTFTDDFEGAKDTSFWQAGTNVDYGVVATQDPSHTGKVMAFNYTGGASGTDTNSEQRFSLPNIVQMEMSYDLFVPANFAHRADSPGNNKFLSLWSGSYGVTASNIAAVIEYTISSGQVAGSIPDFHFGEDGNNYGHVKYFDDSGDVLLLPNDGNWHQIGIYYELAGQEGEYGTFELWLDDKLILSNQWALDIPSAANGVPSSEQIAYSTRGNFIDQGYLMGWCNSGFDADTTFYVDNFEFKSRSSSVGATY